MDREIENILMNVKNKMGGAVQAIYAANMLKIMLIQFAVRMVYKGIL